MFRKSCDIEKMLGMSRSSVWRYKKMIESFPERYGEFAVSGRLILVEAVIDVVKYKYFLERGLESRIPKFERKKIGLYFEK